MSSIDPSSETVYQSLQNAEVDMGSVLRNTLKFVKFDETFKIYLDFLFTQKPLTVKEIQGFGHAEATAYRAVNKLIAWGIIEFDSYAREHWTKRRFKGGPQTKRWKLR